MDRRMNYGDPARELEHAKVNLLSRSFGADSSRSPASAPIDPTGCDSVSGTILIGIFRSSLLSCGVVVENLTEQAHAGQDPREQRCVAPQ